MVIDTWFYSATNLEFCSFVLVKFHIKPQKEGQIVSFLPDNNLEETRIFNFIYLSIGTLYNWSSLRKKPLIARGKKNKKVKYTVQRNLERNMRPFIICNKKVMNF